jgi:hypothetical protein
MNKNSSSVSYVETKGTLCLLDFSLLGPEVTRNGLSDEMLLLIG